jgi:hypothetical protein
MTRSPCEDGGVTGGWARDSRGWWERRDGDVFAIARRIPLRWDVAADAVLPDLGRRRLAHAIRQDLWRDLSDLRGFAPAVEVRRKGGACHVWAGGSVAGAFPRDLSRRVADLLDSPALRVGWIRAAAHRSLA